MPLYEFYCPRCDVTEDIVTSYNNTATHSCGTEMKRKFSIPLVVMKQTASQMALNTLNSNESAHMKPEQKQAAFQGTFKKDKVLF